MTLLVQALEACCVLAEHELAPSWSPERLELHGVEPKGLFEDPSRDPQLRLILDADPGTAPDGGRLDDLGAIAARLLRMDSVEDRFHGRFFRWGLFRGQGLRTRQTSVDAERDEAVRFVERLCDRTVQRPALHVHQEARVLAMTLFAADYHRRRSHQIVHELDEAQDGGEDDRVANLLAEARSLGLRSPRLGLARIWLEERRLDAEEGGARSRSRRRKCRHDAESMFAKPSRFPFWLTALPLALAILLSVLFGLILLLHAFQIPV